MKRAAEQKKGGEEENARGSADETTEGKNDKGKVNRGVGEKRGEHEYVLTRESWRKEENTKRLTRERR